MICTNCNTLNGAGDVFCINCGRALTAAAGYAPYPTPPPVQPSRSAKPFIFVGVGLFLVFLIAAVGLGLFFIVPRIGQQEVLPDHLGMFVQTEAKDRYNEIRKQDFANALDAKATLVTDETLPTIPPAPNLIFSADSRDINVNDMRLVLLDTIKDDGMMKQIDFQVAQIDGRPDMKRLRVIEALANGKYAFAVFDSYLNEGKQRLWPFQVRNSSKSDNGDALKATSVPIKPKEPATKTSLPTVSRPTVVPPPQAGPPALGLRKINGNGVRLRMSPSMSAAFHATFRFNRGATVNVVGYSGYECPSTGKGCGPWAQLDNGYYVHSSLLR